MRITRSGATTALALILAAAVYAKCEVDFLSWLAGKLAPNPPIIRAGFIGSND